jgi:hypothetical protein
MEKRRAVQSPRRVAGLDHFHEFSAEVRRRYLESQEAHWLPESATSGVLVVYEYTLLNEAHLVTLTRK